MIRGFAALIVLLAFLPIAIADSYEISIQADNTAVVTAVIEGEGLHILELPKDAVPEVKGALCLKEGNLLKISIGSTGKAVVSYKTKEFTKGSVLLFSPNNIPLKAVFPKAAEIKSILPQASVAESDTKSVEWINASNIEVKYSLPEEKKSSAAFYSLFAAIFLAIAYAVVLIKEIKIKKAKTTD